MATRRRIRLGGIISATAKQVADAAKAAADALKAQQQIDQQAKADRDAAIAREAETQRQAAEDRAAVQRSIDEANAQTELDRQKAAAEFAAQAAETARLEAEAAGTRTAQATKDQQQDAAIAAEVQARKDAIAALRSELLGLIPPRGVQVVAVGSAAIPALLLGATVDVTLPLSETMPDTAYKVSILRPAALLTTGTEVTVKSKATTTVVLTIKAGLALATGNSVSVVVTR